MNINKWRLKNQHYRTNFKTRRRMNSPTVFLLWKRDKQSSSTCYLLTVPWSLAAQPYHSTREQRAREIKMNFLQIFIPHQSAISMTLEEFFLKAPASFSWQFIPSMSTVIVVAWSGLVSKWNVFAHVIVAIFAY